MFFKYKMIVQGVCKSLCMLVLETAGRLWTFLKGILVNLHTGLYLGEKIYPWQLHEICRRSSWISKWTFQTAGFVIPDHLINWRDNLVVSQVNLVSFYKGKANSILNYFKKFLRLLTLSWSKILLLNLVAESTPAWRGYSCRDFAENYVRQTGSY